MLNSEGLILLMLFPHPTHPLGFGGGADGEEGGGKEPGPLPGIGGLMTKRSLPEGVIILVYSCWSTQVYVLKRRKG